MSIDGAIIRRLGYRMLKPTTIPWYLLTNIVIMHIRRPRGLTNGQVALVTILGVFSGIYIWRPLFDEQFPRKKVAEEAEAAIESK